MSSAEPPFRPIRRLLVANRGEIARRVFRTAHEMGIGSVAVFADGDEAAPFVAEAHRAVALGGRSASETYLAIDKLLEAAEVTGADAIHPGYGFLAESAELARAVVDAGLIWIGPDPEAISAMGDKLAAKSLMAAAGVPTLPSFEITHGQDAAATAAEASDIGFPVLVKAAAGGGGKGMRVVDVASSLPDAIEGARREAAAAFGDDTLFVEKYLPAPRHVEIQVLGDQHGSLVHLFERECSIQRRHQKIIEEAPSPGIDAALRETMGAAAVNAARAIGYHSAGTVEFLIDGRAGDVGFWFLEMNTRIQVEHPVTEQVTGVDLVREQIRVARGERLGIEQADLAIDGHAIEARLYAEDPANGFLPATGTLTAFELPDAPSARIDSGVEQGSIVGVEFDPMLAKFVVHAPTRAEAAARLAAVLENTVLAGLTTNRDFLVATLRTDAFLAGDTTTDFIERVRPPAVFEPDDAAVAEAACAICLYAQEMKRRDAAALAFMPSGYRNSSMPQEQRTFLGRDREVGVRYRARRDGRFDMTVDGHQPAVVSVHDIELGSPGAVTMQRGGIRTSFRLTQLGSRWSVHSSAGTVELAELPRFPDLAAVEVAGGQTAPMPGRVLAVHVAVGDTVVAGQTLVVMEAMKMEHTIAAPGPGVVAELRCQVDAQVDNGEVLVVLEKLDNV